MYIFSFLYQRQWMWLELLKKHAEEIAEETLCPHFVRNLQATCRQFERFEYYDYFGNSKIHMSPASQITACMYAFEYTACTPGINSSRVCIAAYNFQYMRPSYMEGSTYPIIKCVSLPPRPKSLSLNSRANQTVPAPGWVPYSHNSPAVASPSVASK